MSISTTVVSFAISLEVVQDVTVLKADFPLGEKKCILHYCHTELQTSKALKASWEINTRDERLILLAFFTGKPCSSLKRKLHEVGHLSVP